MDKDISSQIVFYYWKQTFEKYGYIITCMESFVCSEYINSFNTLDLTLREKCIRLKQVYHQKIREYATLYSKAELLIGLIAVKEFITKNMSKLDGKLEYINDERVCVNALIAFVYALKISEFKEYPISDTTIDKFSYIGDIFVWGRLLTQLEANMQRQIIAEEKNVSLFDMAFGIVEDEVFHDFYEEYEKQGLNEKFEDYQIIDINILKQTERLKITPDLVMKDVSPIIQSNFGFNLDVLRKFSEGIFKIFFETIEDFFEYIQNDSVVCNCIELPKEFFYMLGEQFRIEKCEIDKIIEVFSFENKEPSEIELACFYLYKDVVYLGPCDLLQVFAMFEKFALSGYFLSCYKKNVNFVELLNPYQKRTSTYMCYVLNDILGREGYKMYMEKFKYDKRSYCSPCAEIKTILKGKINILKDLGDIDVLFLDEYKKQIVCVEYKYFQPAISYEQMSKSDRNKITNQIYEKMARIQYRENAIKENVEHVTRLLGGSGNGYSVKTIIVLARPNMYVFTDEISERIEYEVMTMNQFYEKVMLHDV